MQKRLIINFIPEEIANSINLKDNRFKLPINNVNTTQRLFSKQKITFCFVYLKYPM